VIPIIFPRIFNTFSASSSSASNYTRAANNTGAGAGTSSFGRSEAWDPDDPLGSFLSGAASKALGFGGWVKEKAKDTMEKAKDEGWG
jgi:hypothetical protein